MIDQNVCIYIYLFIIICEIMIKLIKLCTCVNIRFAHDSIPASCFPESKIPRIAMAFPTDPAVPPSAPSASRWTRCDHRCAATWGASKGTCAACSGDVPWIWNQLGIWRKVMHLDAPHDFFLNPRDYPTNMALNDFLSELYPMFFPRDSVPLQLTPWPIKGRWRLNEQFWGGVGSLFSWMIRKGP